MTRETIKQELERHDILLALHDSYFRLLGVGLTACLTLLVLLVVKLL